MSARDVLSLPLVDLAAVHEPIINELQALFLDVLNTQRFVGGERVERFEAEFATYLGVRHVAAVGSGTGALRLGLIAAGIGRGDEVIVPANTFVGTAEAVIAAGAEPVIVDVDEDTALLDPDAAQAAITPRTTAIVPVHLYGQTVDSDQFARLATSASVFYLEDAAQAVGARWRGRSAGGLGDAAGFSFYPTKNLGALGDGGAVTTDDPELARRVRLLRSHGESPQYHHQLPGLTDRLDTLQAAFLSVKLAHVEEDQRLRDEAASYYRALLADVPEAKLLRTATDARHAHHLFVIRVNQRDGVLAALRARGVHAQVHYPTPLHQQPALERARRRARCPVAERLAASVLSLPLYARITKKQIEYAVEALRAAIREVV
jgi:dTDP-4-amino-4,6-dideoxygalactose transaminase